MCLYWFMSRSHCTYAPRNAFSVAADVWLELFALADVEPPPSSVIACAVVAPTASEAVTASVRMEWRVFIAVSLSGLIGFGSIRSPLCDQSNEEEKPAKIRRTTEGIEYAVTTGMVDRCRRCIGHCPRRARSEMMASAGLKLEIT